MKLLTNILNIIKSPNFYVPILLIIIIVAIGRSLIFFRNGMATKLINFGDIKIDFWSISHILLYVYFGYHFPDYFIEFLLIGTLWEYFESVYCQDWVKQLIGCNNSNSFICRKFDEDRDCSYWYGKIDDVAMNMIGFVIGAYLAKKAGKY
jgi:hypothetical protein